MNRNSKHEARVQPLRERLREETKGAISEAAEQVFAQKGVREARVEEIAARAGVSVGTVYNYFEDREGLLADLLEVRRKELAGRLDKALADGDQQPFEGQLRRFTQTVFEHFEAHRPFLAIMLEGDHARMSQPSPAMRELRSRAETLVRRGVESGSLIFRRQKLLPGFLWASIKSVLLADLREPGTMPVNERAEAAIEFFLHGARA